MFLSVTDFDDRPYKVPNQNESPDFEDIIGQLEEQTLIDLFGYEFYTAFVAGYEASSPDQIWVDLAEGVEFERDDTTYKWNGIVDLLKPIVYAKWMGIGSFKFTNVGWVQNSAQQNSVLLDSEQFRVQYVNEFVMKSWTLFAFLEENEADYEDYNLEWRSPQRENRFGI